MMDVCHRMMFMVMLSVGMVVLVTFLSLTFRRLHQHMHMITTNRRIGHLFHCYPDVIG